MSFPYRKKQKVLNRSVRKLCIHLHLYCILLECNNLQALKDQGLAEFDIQVRGQSEEYLPIPDETRETAPRSDSMPYTG